MLYPVNSHPPCGIILPLTEHWYCSIKTEYKTGDVSELADEHDLGSCAARREGFDSLRPHPPILRHCEGKGSQQSPCLEETASPLLHLRSAQHEKARHDENKEETLKIEKIIEENHEAKLVVEVEPEKMDTYKRRAARKISERGKIPGFRPGKAPYHMVVLNYGEQAIMEQAVDAFVDAEYSNILKEAEVEPGDSGTLELIDSLEPPKLTFRVPLAPEVDLGDFRSIRLPYEWSAPAQEEVDKAIEDLRQMYATTENVEREAQEGDYVIVDVKSETPELKSHRLPNAHPRRRTRYRMAL